MGAQVDHQVCAQECTGLLGGPRCKSWAAQICARLHELTDTSTNYTDTCLAHPVTQGSCTACSCPSAGIPSPHAQL